MKKAAIILAGGTGSRFGTDLPKQLCTLGDKPVFAWSVKAFLDYDTATRIILVANARYRDLFESHIANMQTLYPPFDCHIVDGGATRTQSVMNALKLLSAEDDLLIAVHDAARPLVSTSLIQRAWDTALKHGTAIPVTALTDSIRHLEANGQSQSVPRAEYVAVQTPQAFRGDILLSAYAAAENNESILFTDDASVVEHSGYSIHLYQGDSNNFKITNPEDLAIANALI